MKVSAQCVAAIKGHAVTTIGILCAILMTAIQKEYYGALKDTHKKAVKVI